ncbi:MAG: SRPBCC family protein [Jatrophihabitans sp.]|uniref:SRPBCC family protein n=1 Tax=Jatrophihabitans sp. TaxID=1932789 RepID=UPI00390F1C83
MVDIHHEGICEAPLDVAFAYIDDYRNATGWMFGLARFEPVGEQVQGLGAVFDGTFHVKPIKLSSTVKVTTWEQDKLIAFESIKGFKNWSTWEFSSLSPEQTKVTVTFSYDLPGGLAGRAMGRALEPIVAMSVRHTDAALRHAIEAHYRSS